MPFQIGNKLWKKKKTFAHSGAAKKKIRLARARQIITESHKKHISEGMQGGNSASWRRGHIPWNKGLLPEKSHLWKGNDVGYNALHAWVERKLGKPKKCEYCGTENAKKFDWANKSHEYKRELSDWVRLCRSCHQKYDREQKAKCSFNLHTRYLVRPSRGVSRKFLVSPSP